MPPVTTGPRGRERSEAEAERCRKLVDRLTGLAMRHDPTSSVPWPVVAYCTALLDGVSAEARAAMTELRVKE